MSDFVTACPHCDSSNIYNRRFTDNRREERRDLRWYCRNCQENFAEPNKRDSRGNGSRSGLAKRLLEADPDEIGGAP